MLLRRLSGLFGNMEFISEGVHVDNESCPLLIHFEPWGQEDFRPIPFAKGSYLRWSILT